MVRMGWKLWPEAQSRSVTSRRVNSTSQSGSGAVIAAGVRHTAPRTFPSKVDATRYLAQVEADLLRGSWADPKLGRVTFGEWVEQWRATTANLRPGTLVLYDYQLRRFLLPAFGSVPLGRLDTMTVRAWLADLHREAEVTPTTIAKPGSTAALACQRLPCSGTDLPDQREQ